MFVFSSHGAPTTMGLIVVFWEARDGPGATKMAYRGSFLRRSSDVSDSVSDSVSVSVLESYGR